jgi:hypothetical protein
VQNVRGLLQKMGSQESGEVMRFFVGKRVGPVFVGTSVGPFHPGRIFLARGSGGYEGLGWFVWFGYAGAAAALYLAWHCWH